MEKSVFIFDLDGTLADTKPGIVKALNYVLKANQLDIIHEDEGSKFIGPPIKNSLIKFYGMSEEMACRCTELYRKVYVEQFIQDSELYPGLYDVLESLKLAGSVLSIATMKTMPQVDAFLNCFGLSEHFSIIKAASPSGDITKTDMLLEIRKLYDEKYNRFYMVGDTIGDYKASINAGCEFIAADYGYGDMGSIDCKHISYLMDILNFL